MNELSNFLCSVFGMAVASNYNGIDPSNSVSIDARRVWNEVDYEKQIHTKFRNPNCRASGRVVISVQAQTTEEGPGPSEQPSAPMEIGQAKPAQPAQAAQTPQVGEEAKPGGPVGRRPGQN